MEEQQSYTLKETARKLACNPEVLRRKAKAGLIESYKFGNKLRFTEQHIQNFIDRNSTK